MFLKDLNHKKAQAIVEFILIAPIIMFLLLGMVALADYLMDKQKLEMASYYASRLYAKYSIRGVKSGTIYAYLDKKDRIIDEIIKPRVQNFLGREDVEVTNSKGTKVELSLPSGLTFGVSGIGSIDKEVILKAQGEMENDSLEYGGGRSGEDVLNMS
ncbi:MAG: pilus assembly protein [bacterium]|nr:pilus assembly protein [bacterium]